MILVVAYPANLFTLINDIPKDEKPTQAYDPWIKVAHT